MHHITHINHLLKLKLIHQGFTDCDVDIAQIFVWFKCLGGYERHLYLIFVISG